ncbi:MAG: DUF255 domain-containing protein, partial [bacterium]|nr:DUF255 domain-containing protein [bacterium]
VDQIYMEAVMALTGHGGWPMSVFLTPDLKPFFGGTFFRKDQFLSLLSQIQERWQSQPTSIFQAGEELDLFLKNREEEKTTPKPFDRLFDEAFSQFQQRFDKTNKGFGGAPKFPQSFNLSFLLKFYQKTKKPEALTMATETLERMAARGLWDKIGGGFHRYATQADWNEPHYEKMLYDNALLAITYLEAYQVTHQEMFAEIPRQIFNYVLREMTDPEGGFYSAQDAGEVGKEGDYYRLNKEERAQAKPPHKDDKILTAWNGLMIAAMAKGGKVLGQKEFIEAARKAAMFLLNNLYKNQKLLRRYREGDGRFSGTIDDYAFFIYGLLDLHEADPNPEWLETAKRLQEKQDSLFWDTENSGYYFSEENEEGLIARKKDFTEGALPSGNSIAALNLFKLMGLTGEEKFKNRLEKLVAVLSVQASRFPSAFPKALIVIDSFSKCA